MEYGHFIAVVGTAMAAYADHISHAGNCLMTLMGGQLGPYLYLKNIEYI